MKIIADENIPLLLVHKLREEGYEVISISESYHGYSDIKVFEISQKEQGYILTFDKDFGELVYKLKVDVEGVILLRFSPRSVNYILDKVNIILSILKTNPRNNFIVADDRKIRIRKIKKSSTK